MQEAAKLSGPGASVRKFLRPYRRAQERVRGVSAEIDNVTLE